MRQRLDPLLASPKKRNAASKHVQFLRAENARDDEFLGWTSKLFAGSQYAVLYKATAAFLASRSVPANIGVGFVDESGKYQMLILEAERQADAEAATH